MCPPIVGWRSTRCTCLPEFATVGAAWMPAMPPPTTSTLGLISTLLFSSGLCRPTRRTAARTRSFALMVASALLVCTHDTCSRMLTIWRKKALIPAFARAPRNVGSCISGEHDATTTRLRLRSRMSCRISSWPGSEHMYLYSRATAALGSLAAYSASACTSTVPAMLVPQWQTYTPILGGVSGLRASGIRDLLFRQDRLDADERALESRLFERYAER